MHNVVWGCAEILPNFVRSDAGYLDAYIQFFACAVEKNVPLLFSAINFLCTSFLFETKDF